MLTTARNRKAYPMSNIVPRLILEVFEHVNYGGRSNTILEPVRFTRSMGFQDNISSVKVYKGPSFAEAPNYRALFYEHRDFRGRKLSLGPGFYPNIHDIAFNFSDRISSINFRLRPRPKQDRNGEPSPSSSMCIRSRIFKGGASPFCATSPSRATSECRTTSARSAYSKARAFPQPAAR